MTAIIGIQEHINPKVGGGFAWLGC
jgi:hypothetical protein